MEKKLLCILFIFSLFFLNPVDGFGQCTEGPTTSASVSISLQGSNQICSDETISINSTVNPDGGTNPGYQWQVQIGSGSWNDISGEISANLTSYSGVQNNSKFRLKITFCEGFPEEDTYFSNTSSTITVNQVTTATASITSNKTLICSNENISFSASLTNQGGSPIYSWRINGTERGSSSTFSWNQFSDGDSVQLWMTSSKPCATDGDADANNVVESNTITISLKPAVPDAPSAISEPQNVCPNTSAVTYSITSVDRATSYIWTLPSGWTGSSTSTSIDITSGAVGNNQIIKVRAVNECGESTDASLSINVGPGKPATPSSISNPGLICEGDSITLSVTNDSSVSYTWSVPIGWNITSGHGTSQINVNAGNYGENGTISVYASNECLDSDLSSINLAINKPKPGQPGTISGDALVCSGVGAVYSISSVQYADSYEWILDGNPVNGVIGTSFTFNSTSVGNHKLEVIAKNECGASTASSQAIYVDDGTPNATSIIETSGEINFCPDATGIIFNVPVDEKIDTYNWQVPSGWNITAGAGTNQITVTAGKLGNDGQIQFTGSSEDCGSVSASYEVFVKNPAPDVSGLSITGETEICSNSTGVIYEVPSVQYATDYNWTFPANWSLISGQNTNKITVNAGTDDGQVMVEVSNECSASPEVLTLDVITTDGPPAQPGAITSTQEFMANPLICPPLNGLTFSVPYVSSDVTYDWILPYGFNIVDGEGTNSIMVNVTNSGNYNSTETIDVVAMNDCYSSAPTTSFQLIIDDYIITDLGEDQTVCTTQTQINIPGEIRFGNAKKFNPVFSAVNGNGQNVGGNISGTPTNTNNYPNTFTFNYNATATDISSGSVKVSVQVPKPATSGSDPDACGTGYAEMTIFFRPEPAATITTTTAEICVGQTGEVTFTATPNTTLTYKIGSGSNQTIQVDESGTATLTTATLNSDTTYSLVSIQYTQAPNCSKSITGNATIIVNPVPSVDISYADQCNSESAAATVSYSNEIGAWETGTFLATGDLETKINADGSFIPANIAPGTYTVTYTITGSGGCSDVPVTTNVTIYEKVILTTQPENTRICEGSEAQFEVTATGEGLSYQWYKVSATSGNEVSNGTNSVLNLSGISTADAGDYIVVVSGTEPCSSVTSEAALLTVDPSISIESQPVSTTICEGETISLNVTASAGTYSGTDFSYQWYKGTPGTGTAISGANASSLPLNTVTPNVSGDYYVTITGPAGYTCSMATSEVATVEVRPAPTVEIGGNTTICDGESADVIFSAGTPNAVVTYTINGNNTNPQNISLDANGEAVLNTGNLFSTSNSDTDFVYEIQSVAYANDPTCTIALSGSTTITVAPNPEVTISFADNQTEFCTADNTSYTPILEGTGTYSGGTFSSNGLTLNPATGALTPGNEVAGIYTITYTIPAYGGCPEETTSLDISIYEEVQITSQPSNLGICSTSDAEFAVTATGDNLTYQWFKVVGEPDINSGVTETDDSPVTGATSVLLSLPVATSEDAGAYYVKVGGTNACTPSEDSQVASDVVTLNVDEDIVIIEPAEDIRVCDETNASVVFKFVAHANGDPLTFEWIYADGTPVNPDGTHMVSNVESRTDYPGLENITVYEGTLIINEITSADQASYAVRIDGSGNDFNCPEAISNSFNLDVDPLPNAPTATSPIEYCLGETATELTVSGEAGATFTWYDSNGNEIKDIEGKPKVPTPETSTSGSQTYFVTQKDAYCESPQTEVVVTVFDPPSAPDLTDVQDIIYCLGDTATALTLNLNGAASANWYDSESSPTPLGEAPTPQTTAVGTINYWVSFVNDKGCESDKAIIAVHVSALPEIALPADQEICEGETFQITASDNNEISGIPTTYSWNWEGNTDDPLNGAQQDLNPVETTTYTVTATNGNGCINTAQITINVDPQPVAGTLDGPDSVCVSDPNGELNLTDHVGTIARWEYKAASSSSWTAINEETPDANYPFSGLNEATSYRVVLTNGVCEEVYSNEFTITVDPEPVAGQILFKGTDRIFMMCEFPTADYLVPLQTSGTYVGDIIAWQYRRSSATDWSVIKNTDGTNFTGTTLSGQQVNLASNNESTLYRVEVQSGACSPNVFSDNATLSIIPSDIAPNPVTVTREAICLGDTISLSSGTGYGGYGTFEGGAFDNSSIANHGWRVMRYGSNNDGTEYTFESAANNVRPDRWQRTNPKEFMMASSSGTISQLFDTSLGNEGNKGFAIVSGDNPSTLETPIFNTFTMDNPTLTFDQAYNLTAGDVIRVQISLDGGATYESVPLLEITGPATSGNYASFGDGDPQSRPNNKISIPLDQYAGLPNLRIRWLYDGSTGGIYAIDAIGVPQDPENVQLIWYYDADPDNPDNALEQIGEINQSTVSFTPDKIGWNYFEVQTALVFDTNGDPCQSAENMATIRVYVFDSYTTTATANVGSCGSTEVPLKGLLTGGVQGEIPAFPLDDESTLAWSVISGPDGYNFSESHFTPSISDPNAIFTPPIEGPYTLSWKITPAEDNSCTIQNGEVTFNFAQCTTLDFDGQNDYVDLRNNYNGNYFIEAWIRPFDRQFEDGSGSTDASEGVIFSSSGFEIRMENLPAGIQKNTRWYHIAVAHNGDLWVDGIPLGNITVNGSGINNTSIGARYNANTKTTSNHFSGWIEEVRIWDKVLTDDQIQFMMNQRLQNAGNMGVEIPMPVPGNLTYANLAGYYRLVSAEPDPSGLGAPWGVTFDAALMPANGLTPNLANAAIPGRLYNMTTNQENTAPMPYISAKDTPSSQLWATDDTWLRPAVWDAPNSKGIDGTTPIDWNIVRINHNIDSGDRDITVLGLKSETAGKLLTITRSGDQENYTNPGQMLRVTHYLLLNGNIDLVGESQLLQDPGSILAEASSGYLERDQQGKRNSFVYNYWSSPVSAQGAANNALYNVKSVLMDGTTPSNPQNITFIYDYWAADGATTSNPITISTYWLWGYSPAEANIYAEWDHILEVGTLKTGEGFTMKGTNGSAGINEEQNYTFKGKPHNGDFDLSMAAGQNYLIGNPFPSAMDADEFIFDNLINVSNGRNNENVFDGALYFWDHFQELNHILKEYVGGYATYNLSGGVPAISNDERINANDAPGEKYPGQYIPVGQAFLINSSDVNAAGFTVTGGNIHFKNSQRIFKREKPVDDSQFLKPEVITKTNKEKSQDKSKIRISFKSPVGYHRQILVAAIPSTTNGFDLGYDAMLFDDNAEDMYWLQGDNQLVIQGVPNFDKDQVLPLGVKIKENKEFRIKIDTVENAAEGMMVYLNDKLKDSIHDLRKEAYVSTSQPGTIHDRFEIIFFKDEPVPPVTEVPGDVEEIKEFGISIRHGQTDRELRILNPHELAITNMYIFDLNGNKLEGHSDLPGDKEFTMPVRNYSSGVYIVQILVEGRVVSKKIIINN